MSYLYTPTDQWVSPVTVPSNTDLGRASGELHNSLKLIADRNAWLAKQVEVEFIKVSPVTHTTNPPAYESLGYTGWCQLTVDTTALSALIVMATPLYYDVLGIVNPRKFRLHVNGTLLDQATHSIDVNVPAPNIAFSACLFGATSAQSAALPVTFAANETLPGGADPSYLQAVFFTLIKVRS